MWRDVMYRVGFALRESGQALERLGCRMQGIDSFAEEITRLRPVANFFSKAPTTGQQTFVAPTAAVIGDVRIGDKSSVWYNCVVRGDVQPVTIGANTNIQDGAHIGSTVKAGSATTIGNNVSVGHGAYLRGCTVGDNTLIGIGSVLKEGCQVQGLSLIAAGAVVEADTVIESGQVWGGNPAKMLRSLKPYEIEYLKTLPDQYAELSAQHRDVLLLLYGKMGQAAAGQTVALPSGLVS